MPNRARALPLALVLSLLLVLTRILHLEAQFQDSAPQPVVRYAERQAVSPPLRSLEALPLVSPGTGRALAGAEPYEVPRPSGPRQGDDRAGGEGGSSLLQPSSGLSLTTVPAPSRSFDGSGNEDNAYLTGRRLFPPDTNGDVGPNHYVQMLNVILTIWDKDGNRLAGPMRNRSLWSSLGGACADKSQGDPIVLYDSLADRWLMSEFAFDSDLSGTPSGPFYECIAISQTPDPTGPWYLYAFLMSETKMNDYPKFGVWPDAYYMSVNQFVEGSGSWGGVGAVAFERERMLQGQPARMVFFDLGDTALGYFGLLPADLDGWNQPPKGSPNYFVAWDDKQWLGDAEDTIRIWEFRVNWQQPSLSTFGLGGNLPNQLLATSDVDPNLCGYSRRCIPQPFTTQRVDAISDRLMHRLAYRRFGSHEALVTNHSVDVDAANHAGIHWFELRRRGGTWALHQEGVYAPDEHHRWMGSIAMDQVGNIALGYSVSSEDVFPSVRYTGREAGDPPGTLSQAEVALVSGLGSQSTYDRWGDYSMMAVDPADDCTFWYTQQYYDQSGFNWKTRIGAFKFPSCQTQWVNLGITKSAWPQVAGAGDPVTYTLAYRNAGPSTAYGVVISDVVPAELEGVRFESSRPVTPTGAFNYTWQVGDLAALETGAITLTGRIAPDLEGTRILANRASTGSMGSESDPADNDDTAEVRVNLLRFYFPLVRSGWNQN